MAAERWSLDGEVTIITCDASRAALCPAQRALGFDAGASPSELRQVCRRCSSVSPISKKFSYRSLASASSGFFEIPESLDSLLTLEVDGHQLGRSAVYDYLLSVKKRPSELTDEDLPNIKAAVTDSVDIFTRMRDLLRSEKFDVLIINNELYGMCAAAKAAAAAEGCETLNLNLGWGRTFLDKSLWFSRDSDEYVYVANDLTTSHLDATKLSAPLVDLLEKELAHRLYRRHSLSYGVKRRSRTDLSSSQMIANQCRAALVLSSEDEQMTYAFVKGQPQPNIDQSGLLRNFLAVARDSPNEAFFVRMHPRMGPNRRDRGSSSARWALEEILADAPRNLFFDPVGNERPIVEVLRASRSIVVSWSSIGLDAASLGIPVIFGLPGYPLNYPTSVGVPTRGGSALELSLAIDTALTLPPEMAQRRAIAFWSLLLDAHQSFRLVPINLSPAMVLLALQQRGLFSAPNWSHSMLRRLELVLSRRPGAGLRDAEWSFLSRAFHFDSKSQKLGEDGGLSMEDEALALHRLRKVLHS